MTDQLLPTPEDAPAPAPVPTQPAGSGIFALSIETLPGLVAKLQAAPIPSVLVIDPVQMTYRILPTGHGYVRPSRYYPEEVPAGGIKPTEWLTAFQVGDAIEDHLINDAYNPFLPLPWAKVYRNNQFRFVYAHKGAGGTFLWCGMDNKSYRQDEFSEVVLFNEELEAVLYPDGRPEASEEAVPVPPVAAEVAEGEPSLAELLSVPTQPLTEGQSKQIEDTLQELREVSQKPVRRARRTKPE